MSRRERKILRRKGKKYKSDSTLDEGPAQTTQTKHVKKEKRNKFLEFYDKNYKKNMWITIVLLIISIIIIGTHTAMYGEFIPRGVSLKGGVTITVPYDQDSGQSIIDTDSEELQSRLRSLHPQASINVRTMSSAGEKIGFITDASDVDSEELLESIRSEVGDFDKFSMETMGSSLGEAFFKQTMFAILIAFILMSIVVFLSFKTFVPSFAVILSAVSDILMTVAVLDLFRIRVETAGIAALLMLIGYSVDTDVLLTTRVLKRTGGTVFDRIIGAMKTGMTMTVTSISAVTIALIFTQSEVLKQIMLILLIGLILDIPNTWIQNVGILRMYIERKSKKKAAATLAEFGESPEQKEEIVDAEFEDDDEHAEHKGHPEHHEHHSQHSHHKDHAHAEHAAHHEHKK